MDDAKQRTGWKQRAVHETVEYGINVLYLAIVFGLFAWYRRLILAEYQISYLHYGVAIVEALVLAKVILIGDMLGLSGAVKDKPLIYPTVYNSVVFSIFVGLFGILEHTIGGWLRGKGLVGGLIELWDEGRYELLARCLVIFFLFIPFFAVKELRRTLGEGRLGNLFFRKKIAAQPCTEGVA